MKRPFPSGPSRRDRSPSLESQRPKRLRLPEDFTSHKKDYTSQRSLRRRDRKRRASRVSLRVEPNDYGGPGVVADEVRGAAGWEGPESPKKSLFMGTRLQSARDLLVASCRVTSPAYGPDRETEALAGFLIKGSVAGGAVYLVYDQELLGSSDKSQAALKKAGDVVPPAMYQFSQYVCQQTGLQIPQLPAPPKIHFSIRDSWNAGIITVMSALSVAPSKACEYSKEGWEYVKARTK
ncbi:MICOS complex subunit MIC13 [Plecturocebus cupreus]